MPNRDLRINIDADASGVRREFKSAADSAKVFERELAKIEKARHAAMTDLGGVTAGFGAAMLAGFGVAVKAAADFDKAMSGVAAASDATGAQLDALRQAAIKAGADTAFSASEAAQAETELAKVGISTADILGGALKGALDLAAAGQLDLGEAAAIAGEAMTIFNLKGQDVGHVADVLTAGANASSASVQSMAESLQQAGLVAAQTGLSLEDTVGTLTAFSKAGLNGSDAGTSLKTMLQRLSAPTSQAAALMEELGIQAYDAQGNFVGIATVAGQLRQGLGQLTPAQRQAALATIFGSDAIRAATVLYTNGEQGIRGYIKAVNDQGAAARMAGKLTDNLAGDLERLKGALETALIQTGSGAADALRVLVQAAGGAVDIFNDLPQPLQTSVSVLGGLVGAVTTVSGAFLLGVPKIAEYKAALADMGPRAQRFGSALGAVGSFLTGPWGIAVGAAVVGLGYFAVKHAEAQQRVQELTTTLDRETGAFTDSTRAMVTQRLESDGVLKAAQQLKLNLSDVVDAALGVPGAMDKISAGMQGARDKAKALDDQYDSGITAQNEYAINANTVRSALDGQNSDLRESREEWQRNAEAMKGTKAAADPAAEAITGIGSSAADSKDDVADLKRELDDLTKSAFDNIDADIAYQQAIDDVSESIKQNGRNHDTATEAGRANMRTLRDLAKTANDYRLSQIELEAPQAEVAKLARAQRKDFINSAIAMGFKRDQAVDLANKLGLIPEKVDTKISTPGYQQAMNNAATAKQRMRELDAMHPSVTISANASPAYGALNSLLARISSSSASVRVGVMGGYSVPGAHADGGYISGPGSGTSDSIPAMLSNGEFVVNARATARNRPLLESINAQKYATGGYVEVQHFADGGMAEAPLSEFYDRFMGREVSKSTYTKAVNARKDAVAQLAKAERKLAEDRKKHRSARTIADDEARVAKERRDLTAATDKLKETEAAYKKAKLTPAQRLTASLTLGIKNTKTFIANITKLADAGYGALAQNLLAVGGADAEAFAASAVKLSSSKLKALNSQVKTAAAQQAQLDQLPAILAIKDARKSGAKSIAAMMQYTGLSEEEIAAANQVAHLFAAGGIMRYASGGVRPGPGVATRPTVLFGEGRFPEAYVPYDPAYRSRATGLVRQLAADFGMGGGAPVNHIIVQGALDPLAVARQIEQVMTKLWRANGRSSTNVPVRR